MACARATHTHKRLLYYEYLVVHTWKMPPTNASPQVLACQDKISRSISCITGVTVRPWRLLEENIEYTTHKKAELGVNEMNAR